MQLTIYVPIICLWWYRYKLPDTHTIICAHNTLSLSVCTISVASRVLVACLSRVSLYILCSSHLALQLLCQCLYIAVLGHQISWLYGWSSQCCLPRTDMSRKAISSTMTVWCDLKKNVPKKSDDINHTRNGVTLNWTGVALKRTVWPEKVCHDPKKDCCGPQEEPICPK
jgi:hypothetical protein